MEELHQKLDQLELILSGAEILQFYGTPQTVTYISETRSDPKIAKDTLRLLIKNVVSKGKVVKPREVNKLLEHLIKLSKDLYPCCDMKLCHQVWLKAVFSDNFFFHLTA